MTKAAADAQVMISITHYDKIINHGIVAIRGKDNIPCPCCNSQLMVHGTCIRKVRSELETTVYRLRVLQCCNEHCMRTHRELPDFITPYKRYGSDTILDLADCTDNTYTCETRTWLILKAWVYWFFCYAENVLSSLQLRYGFVPDPLVSSRHSRYKFLVQIVVNNNLWQQHRSDVT